MDEELIQMGLRELGVAGREVAVHSSLKSFGHVPGGAETVIRALLRVCGTVLMPSFCEIGRTNPPPDDRPSHNGWDYETYQIDSRQLMPFDPDAFDETTGLNAGEMGAIPAQFLQTKGTLRSKHPSVSWAANGPAAGWYVADHVSGEPNLPLKRLRERKGFLVLLGVDLAQCTAGHLAEEIVGRRPLMRWILHADGTVRRVREFGCSDGFPKLAPYLEALAWRSVIGRCHAVSYPIQQFVDVVVEVLTAQPQITLCDRTGLCRCQDSVKGGPRDD